MRAALAVLAATLLLAACGDKATLEGWCEKRIQSKGGHDTSVNCDCFAKTIASEGGKDEERKEMYRALMSVVPLYAAGKDEQADAELGKKGLKYRLGAAALIANGALQCAVVKWNTARFSLP